VLTSSPDSHQIAVLSKHRPSDVNEPQPGRSIAVDPITLASQSLAGAKVTYES